MFVHGTLAALPLDRRHATVLLGQAAATSVPTLQVVVVASASLRTSAGSSHSASCGGTSMQHVLQQDMPAAVPLARWDWELLAQSAGTSKAPARFGSFLPGAHVPITAITIAIDLCVNLEARLLCRRDQL